MDTDSKDLLDILTLTYLALTSKTEGKGSKAKQVTTDRLADEALADLARNGYIHVSKGPGERPGERIELSLQEQPQERS